MLEKVNTEVAPKPLGYAGELYNNTVIVTYEAEFDSQYLNPMDMPNMIEVNVFGEPKGLQETMRAYDLSDDEVCEMIKAHRSFLDDLNNNLDES